MWYSFSEKQKTHNEITQIGAKREKREEVNGEKEKNENGNSIRKKLEKYGLREFFSPEKHLFSLFLK